MPESSLQSLLERRAAFLAFVQRRVGDRSLAEDIVQAAYVRAIEHTSTLREEQSVTAWFFSVLRNAIVDHYRRNASESSAMDKWAVELGLSADAPEPVAPEAIVNKFVCGCIEQVLPALRPAYAEVLREVDLNELPLTDFARRHQLTAGNAGVRIHRARAALKKSLASFCGACSVHACLDCVCKQSAQTKRVPTS